MWRSTVDPNAHFVDDDEELIFSQTDNPQPARHSEPASVSPQAKLKERKSIYDRVHGQVSLPGLLVAVMDTPEFQRLDDIQQLGGTSFVYPSASHTRKEHSIGVAHLALQMVEALRLGQKELAVDHDDVVCIGLAGLVHDLGHGPFSHMFEEFMHRMEARVVPPPATSWTHEAMSGMVLRNLVKDNDIPLEEYFTGPARPEEHIEFVIKLVDGLKDDQPWPTGMGRGEEKRWMFDIVSNKRHGIDVDKLDYLVRDSMATFGSSKPPTFDVYRLIHATRVMQVEGAQQVCFQMKMAHPLIDLYAFRARLHEYAYQHRICGVAEAMITDILEAAADSDFKVRGHEGKALALHEAARCPRAFVRLTDAIIGAIDLSPDPTLHSAQHLIRRLKCRQFYTRVGPTTALRTQPSCCNPECNHLTDVENRVCPQCGTSLAERPRRETQRGSNVFTTPRARLKEGEAKKQIIELCPEHVRAELERVVHVNIVDIKYGLRKEVQDPFGVHWEVYREIEHVTFYNPKNADPDQVIRISADQVSQTHQRKSNHQRTLYLYLKEEDVEAEVVGALEAAYRQWRDQENAGWTSASVNGEETPAKSTVSATPPRPPLVRVNSQVSCGDEPAAKVARRI